MVLLVDDQPELRRLFKRSLNRAGYVVVEAGNGQVAVELVQQLHFDVVISDVHMPDMSGMELLGVVGDLDPNLPVVLTSGSPDPVSPHEADARGAFVYLLKPVPFELMLQTTERAVAHRRALLTRETLDPAASVERLRVPGNRTSGRA